MIAVWEQVAASPCGEGIEDFDAHVSGDQ